MAQIFHRATNSISRASLCVALLAPVAVIGGLSGLSRSTYNTKVNTPLEQPAPFSHQHHALELGIDCRYCHSNVEKSAYADVPPTHTCMSCHSQIWTNSPLLQPVRESYRSKTPLEWNQVNKVPEFVYFNHSIHINRGLNCNNCHGAIEKMALTYKAQPFQMRWCLECHRNPEKYLYNSNENEAEAKGEEGKKETPAAPKKTLSPREQVFDLYWRYQAGEHLTNREEALMDGSEYSPNAKEVEQGEELVKQLGVKKAQLTDCSVCHR